MSKEAITKVVQRAISDAGFRRQLTTDPTGALRGFDLSADETAALRVGDAGRLSALGVDQRMSKAFALGGASAFTRADVTGGTDAYSNALVSGDESNAAAIDDGTSVRMIIPTEPGANISADVDGGAGMSSADIDDSSDAYLTKVGYDPDATATADADVRETTWSGDDIAGPSTDSASAAEGAPDQTDGPSITP